LAEFKVKTVEEIGSSALIGIMAGKKIGLLELRELCGWCGWDMWMVFFVSHGWWTMTKCRPLGRLVFH